MTWESRAENAVFNRNYRITESLRQYQSGEISRQKFYGTIRKETRFAGSFWEADFDFSYQNQVLSHAEACKRLAVPQISIENKE